MRVSVETRHELTIALSSFNRGRCTTDVMEEIRRSPLGMVLKPGKRTG